MNLVRVEVSKDMVYVDTASNKAYVVRRAEGRHIAKKFDPTDKDLRFIDMGAIREPLLDHASAEYQELMKALTNGKKNALVGFGDMFKCKFPQDFQEKVLWW